VIVKLRILEFNNGKTRLQFWNTPDGYAPHWVDVPVVKFELTKCGDCGGVGGLWDARCTTCNGRGVIQDDSQ
jgi:hypothetical protein